MLLTDKMSEENAVQRSWGTLEAPKPKQHNHSILGNAGAGVTNSFLKQNLTKPNLTLPNFVVRPLKIFENLSYWGNSRLG